MTPLGRQVQQVPDAIGSLEPIERADYLDVFTVATGDAPGGSPEEWARTVVERGAGPRGQFVWRALMGLRLDPRSSPDRIGGWRIAERGDTWIRLEASSWCATAHVTVHRGNRDVTVATALHYDRAVAEPLWLPLAAAHRRAMPRLLGHAARLQKARAAEVSSRGR